MCKSSWILFFKSNESKGFIRYIFKNDLKTILSFSDGIVGTCGGRNCIQSKTKQIKNIEKTIVKSFLERVLLLKISYIKIKPKLVATNNVSIEIFAHKHNKKAYKIGF